MPKIRLLSLFVLMAIPCHARADELIVTQTITTRFNVDLRDGGSVTQLSRTVDETRRWDGETPDDPDDPTPPSDISRRYQQIIQGLNDTPNAIQVGRLIAGMSEACRTGNLKNMNAQQIATLLGASLDIGIPSAMRDKWQPFRLAINADFTELQVTGRSSSADVGRMLGEVARGIELAVGDLDPAQAKQIVTRAAAAGEAIGWSEVFRILVCVLQTDFKGEDVFMQLLRCIVGGG